MTSSHDTGIWSVRQLNFNVALPSESPGYNIETFSQQIIHLWPLNMEGKKTDFFFLSNTLPYKKDLLSPP